MTAATATKPVCEWKERRSGLDYAKATAKPIKEMAGYLLPVEGDDEAVTAEINLLAGLRFIPVGFIAAMKESAAREAVEELLADFAERTKEISWAKIDLTETCEDGRPYWAFDPEDYEAVWTADFDAGSAHIKQPKGGKRFLLTMRFEDRYCPTLRYQFGSLAEAKRVGSLIAVCGGIPEDESFKSW